MSEAPQRPDHRSAALASATPLEIRRAARAGRTPMTSGLAPGFLQGNLVVVPAACADELVNFCRDNPAPLPLIAVGRVGDPLLPELGTDVDVRLDLGGYQVWQDGALVESPRDLTFHWRTDDVALVLGCWFSQESALLAAGVRLRHVELGLQGGLFRTRLACRPAGRFHGPVVVSARPFAADEVSTVVRLTSGLPAGHGGPLHQGDPAAIGIPDLSRPDFGEPLLPLDGETMLYWGCGLTATEALRRARIPRFLTHRPGCMLVTDRPAAMGMERG
jgi:uncharacterized protein YcsI (UPF0317 family)